MEPKNQQEQLITSKPEFYIVGVGASAGGLEALEKLFSSMPSNTGAAYVVIQHLSPTHKSLMAELLAHHTEMPVHYARDGQTVRPDHIYFIPPNHNINFYHGKLYLTEQDRRGINFPIDLFFESLAEDWGSKAVGIVLSGTGSDGTKGIRAIKEQGGLVLVQTPETAKFDGMPRSAVATNLADLILPVVDMPQAILNYINHAGVLTIYPTEENKESITDLQKVLAFLRKFSGVDFSLYKMSTVMRRIEHRMGLRQVHVIQDYVHLLEDSEDEVRALYREMLIGVTRFFRNPGSFEKLDTEVLRRLVEGAAERSNPRLRVWVPGCSSGEEVYSLAILIYERLRKLDEYVEVKIFATDVDQQALNTASTGLYPSSIVADVPKEYLQRYFIKQGDQYQVSRELRQMIIFAPHNVLKDPPFSRVDLISCRNLLIYLNTEAQDHVLRHFAYASAPKGFVFLGGSETVADARDMLVPIDPKNRIFQNSSETPRQRLTTETLNTTTRLLSPVSPRRRTLLQGAGMSPVFELFEDVLAKHFPPSVIVDTKNHISHCFGQIDPFLKIPMGRVDMDLSKVAHPDLRVPLGTALYKIFTEGKQIYYPQLSFTHQDENIVFDLIVEPLATYEEVKAALIIFRPVLSGAEVSEATVIKYDLDEQTSERVMDLERKLRYTEESLQATIEELETSNEELQATNEELMASNEELQSTNEELQSTNEELLSVNAELQEKVRLLTELNADMDSLLENLDVSTIFVDTELRIRKFSQSAMELINLNALDIGRPIFHFSHVFSDFDLKSLTEKVMKSGEKLQQIVQTENNHWFLLRMYPQHMADGRLQGLILMFLDVTRIEEANQERLREVEARKKLESQLEINQEMLDKIMEISSEVIYIFDLETQSNVTVNDRIGSSLGFSPEEIRDFGDQLLAKLIHPDDLSVLSEHLQAVGQFENDEVAEAKYRIRTKDGNWRIYHSRDTVFRKSDDGKLPQILGTITDVTDLTDEKVEA